jgi:succinate-acetate transporter protein
MSSATIPLLDKIKEFIVNPLIEILYALAFIIFLWGIFEFVMGSGDEKARETGKQHIIYGLLGLFILVSAFGIVNLIIDTIR